MTGINIIFIDQSTASQRVGYIMEELSARGLHPQRVELPAGDELAVTLARIESDNNWNVVLFDRDSPPLLTQIYLTWQYAQVRTLPVRCDPFQPAGLMADIVHADIYGIDEANDQRSIEALVCAIQGKRRSSTREVKFPG
jgi:hypothetical protein